MFDLYFCLLFIFTILLILRSLYKLLESEKYSGYRRPIDEFTFYPVDESTRTRLYQTGAEGEDDDKNDDDAMELLKCNVREATSCSDPKTRCVHMSGEFKVVRSKTDKKISAAVLTYPPNKTIYEGYCLDAFSANADAKRQIQRPLSLDSCNPNTAERMLFLADVKTTGYKIGCVCKYPDMFTQRIPLESDCDVPVACEGGRLVGPNWMNADGVRVDVVRELSCADCPIDAYPSRDASTGRPVCRRRTFAEKINDDSYPKNFPLLSLDDPAVEPAFAEKFSHPDKRSVPNPCAFDFFTTKPFTRGECELARTADGSIFFCKSNDIGVATLQADDDYLRGNGGRWANGCIRFTENASRVDFALAEFYNVAPRDRQQKTYFPAPVIGYAIKPSAVSSDASNIIDYQNMK